MRFNFRKIASTAASVAMLGSTVALAAAASFDNHVSDGNVAVVYGSNLDLSAVTDITSAISSAYAGSGGSSSGGVPQGGDFAELSKSSDKLNLGNAWTIVGNSLDDNDLSTILADGEYSTDENEDHDYTQKIELGANTLTHFADSDYNDEEPTIGFQISSDSNILNYTLDFTSQPESDVSGGDLVDFESTNIEILGKSYFILDFDNSTLDITLLDAANSALLQEGETITVVSGGKSYDVSISFIGSTEVVLVVNGQTTNTLSEQQTQKLPDGSYIGIKDILVQDYAGGVKQVEFSIGSGKLLLDNGSPIELNDEDVDEVKAYVTRGSSSGGREKLDKIVLEWRTDDEMFLTADEDLVMPGLGSVKFSMNEFVTPHMEEIQVTGDSDNLELRLPIEDGDASFGLLYVDSTGNFTGIGESSTKLLVTSNSSSLTFNDTAGHEYFVASWASSTDSESYLLRATSFEHDSDTGVNRTTIQNVVTGDNVCEDVEASDDCDIGSVSLTIGTVFDSGSNEWVTLTAGSGVSFHEIYTAEGLKIYLPVEGNLGNPNANPEPGTIAFSFNATNTAGYTGDSWYLFMDEEDKDDTIAGGIEFNLTLNDNSDNEPQVSQVNGAGTGGPSGKEIGETNEYETYIVSDLATRIVHDTDPDRDSATVTYHGDESYAEVFISESGVTSGSGSSLGTISVMDDELSGSGMASRNLILVGGSCVNSVTAQVLGLSFPACGPAWESATDVGSGEWMIQVFANPNSASKVATVVGGYEQGDTVNAATALRTLDSIDITEGNKYVGTTADAATPVVEQA